MNPDPVKINLQNSLTGNLCIIDNARKLLEFNIRENHMEIGMRTFKTQDQRQNP